MCFRLLALRITENCSPFRLGNHARIHEFNEPNHGCPYLVECVKKIAQQLKGVNTGFPKPLITRRARVILSSMSYVIKNGKENTVKDALPKC